ncbi:ATP synthase subunit I [Camelliibacillus cellulosilyticus]|uniref:ATP synthase subunit I n=1 Tax=Camelliibacillus cellulosilyticus TaxID=2174486 RepID=A0ABV9GPD0_9BACL
MAELAWYRRLILILSSCILGIFILLWFFTPAKSLIAGFILGGVISLYNTLYLARRIRIIGLLAMKGFQRHAGTGLLNRLIMVVFGVIIVYRFPNWFDYRTMIAGLLIGYVLMVITACLHAKKEKAEREGRVMLGNHTEN